MLRITVTLHEDQYTFWIMSRSIRRIKNGSYKAVGKIETHFLYSITFFRKYYHFYIMWKNIVEPDRPQKTIWRIRCTYWIPKATNTFSRYVILITFPLQQWLHECAQYYIIRTLSAFLHIRCTFDTTWHPCVLHSYKN